MPVTVRDVAKAANVSPGTVSKVLNDSVNGIRISAATRQRVLNAANALNYHPNVLAQRLASAKSFTVGVVIDNYLSFGGIVNAEILQGLGEELDANGYSTVFFSRKSKTELSAHLHSAVMSKQIDSCFIWTSVSTELCAFLLEQQVPHCHLADFPPNLPACPAILSDNRSGGYQATAHLLAQGHTSIAILVDEKYPAGKERLQGYCDAFQERGITYKPHLVVHGAYRRHNQHQIDSAQFNKVLQECTAVFATSDFLVVAAKELMQTVGYSPGVDKALVGFDDIALAAHLTPPLTTVAQDGYSIGSQGAQYLLGQMTHAENDPNQEPYRVYIPTRLVVRESSLIKSL